MIELIAVPSRLTIQDSGRVGYRKLGIPVAGFMDDVSARLTNYLVGNPGGTPLLEFLLRGPTIKFRSSTVFAVGGDVEVRLNDVLIGPWRSYWAKTGDVLEIGTMRSGLYGYVAFAGGVKCEKLMGSCSAYPRAGLGRILSERDELALGYAILTGKEGRYIPPEFRPEYGGHEKTVRVILGPNLDHFTKEGVETFLTEAYVVTPESDRMGYRLDGREIEHSERGAGIVTEPLVPGSVQVPANGKPIIMMKDAQTTGGYAKVAIVASVDMHIVAQTRPGERLRFVSVDVEEAYDALKKSEIVMRGIERALNTGGHFYRVRAGGGEFVVLTHPTDAGD